MTRTTFPLQHLYKSLSLLVLLVAIAGCQKEMEPNEGVQALEAKSKPTAKAMRESSSVATDWYNLQTRIMLNATPALAAPVTARFFGYEGIALYEAVRHGIPNSVSLSTMLYQMPAMPAKENGNGYSWDIAANAALAYMTRNMFPNLTAQNRASIDSLEAAYNSAARPGMESQVFLRSQEYGQAVAAAVFEWSKSDRFSTSNAPYTPPTGAGLWVPTPPAFAAAGFPYLANARPFLEESLTGIIEPFPYTYSEVPGSAFYNEVYKTYLAAKNATPEQVTIARFWADVGVGIGYTTPGHHIKILTSVLETIHADLGTAAMAYAKAGIAIYDAFFVLWRSKYTYNLIRPVTYIRNLIDPSFTPNITTPNHPEYPSAHATITAAFMDVMAGLFGENFAFTDNTYSFLGYTPRTYSSFDQAALEVAWSRVYGGIHYQASIEAGLELGAEVGSLVNALKLQQK